jgi:hypothetical protein
MPKSSLTILQDDKVYDLRREIQRCMLLSFIDTDAMMLCKAVAWQTTGKDDGWGSAKKNWKDNEGPFASNKVKRVSYAAEAGECTIIFCMGKHGYGPEINFL